MAGSILFRKNATIAKAERASGYDKYGRPKLVAIPSVAGQRVHLEKSTRRTIGTQGETVTVDGTMMVPRRFDLDRGDRIEMKDGTVWEVWAEDESLDVVNARAIFRQYQLTRKRQT